MTDAPFQSVERRLGVSGKLLIAPVFILLLFGLVTFYSVREFQNLDQRMETVATELAPETAVATEVLVKLYQLRLQAFDYYQTGNEDILARFQQLESELLAELERARSNLQAPERVRQVDQIEQATLQYARIFRDELVPVKPQVQRIVAEQLDEYGPAASEALRRAIDGITNRAPDSPLRVALEQLINDTLLMRVATQRYFADGTDDSEHQREQITQVAAAMQEMGSTSDEIASNTSDTDESARHAAQLAETGQVTVSKAVDSVARLAEQVQEAARAGDAVNRIADMTTQVASATEQQRATAAEMTRNVEASSSAIDDLSADIAQVNQSGQSLAGMAGEMSTLVRRFQVD